MVEILFHKDIILGPSGIIYKSEPHLATEDQEEAQHIAQTLGSSKVPQGLKWEDFEAALPSLSFPNIFSERGEMSLRRICGKMKTSHRERLARALLDRFETTPSKERLEFSTIKAEGVRDFEFDHRKFTAYLLNCEHPRGGSKAKFFLDGLGIELRDWRFLADQIERGMATAPIYRAEKNTFGFSHGALVLVTGRNGKAAVLETGWIIEAGGPARFVTAYPYDSTTSNALVAAEPFVVDPDLTNDERWAAIYERALAAGESAAQAVQPSPMVLDGYRTEWEGLCGFGWVQLPDGRRPMARWLLKTGNGSRAYPGVTVWSTTRTQSLDRNRAWAEAFARVLLANGIDCSAKNKLD